MAPPSNLGRSKENFVRWKESRPMQNNVASNARGTHSSGTWRRGQGRQPSAYMTEPMEARAVIAGDHLAGGTVRIALQTSAGRGVRTHNFAENMTATTSPPPRTTTTSILPASLHAVALSEVSAGGHASTSRQTPLLRCRATTVGQTAVGGVAFNDNTRRGQPIERASIARNLISTGSEQTSTQQILMVSSSELEGSYIGRAPDKQLGKRGQRFNGVECIDDVLWQRMSHSRGERTAPLPSSASVSEGNSLHGQLQSRMYPEESIWTPDRLSTGTDRQDNESVCEDYEEQALSMGGNAKEEQTGNFSFYNDDDVAMSADSQKDEEDGGPVDDPDNNFTDIAANVGDPIYQTETEKRRERRHELVARRREGDRRRAEGLPRNYLLVDEFRNEPYGQGVGSWRKELMLLSRGLDPAIGNINRQPEDAVKRIGEWIQHTWEYSRPVRWEYVKEVIACGVSLRRSELWKRIRLKQPKPEKLSDRSWRSLERELQSPVMIKKSQNCSKANACRQNFGRTGPSGEIGVRERLRRQLKRSPSPTEIRREMARPKGYARRSRRHHKVDKVMHGADDAALRAANRESAVNIIGGSGHFLPEDLTADRVLEMPQGITTGGEGERDCIVPSGVLSLLEEQVSQHPAFQRMMERLEALQRRAHTSSGGADDVEQDDSIPIEAIEETPEQLNVEEDVSSHNVVTLSCDNKNGVVEAVEAAPDLTVRKSSRLKEKTKQ